jgi:archaellum component FlaC
MQAIFNQLNTNLQLIYRKAIDADNAIDKLQAQGKGKFATIFGDHSGFEVRSKRFSPYVKELAMQINDLNKASQQELEAALPDLIKKIEVLFSTLANFKTAISA